MCRTSVRPKTFVEHIYGTLWVVILYAFDREVPHEIWSVWSFGMALFISIFFQNIKLIRALFQNLLSSMSGSCHGDQILAFADVLSFFLDFVECEV